MVLVLCWIATRHVPIETKSNKLKKKKKNQKKRSEHTESKHIKNVFLIFFPDQLQSKKNDKVALISFSKNPQQNEI